jgi:template-activating factor I
LQLNEEASDKVLEVETEYNKKRRPHYEKRSIALRRIPGFWKDVILSHSSLEQFFSPADKDVLDHLVEVSSLPYDSRVHHTYNIG